MNDPDPGPDDPDRRRLADYVLSRGGTAAQVDAAPNLGELALDLNLRPGPYVTLADVVAEIGMDPAQAERLMTALGLPVDPEQRMTVAEAEVLRLLHEVGQELFGDDATVQVARVAGNAMARMADSLVATFRLRFELPRRAAGVGDYEVVQDYTAAAERLLPAFVGCLDALLRRQIVAVAERVWSTDDERSTVTLPRAVGFVDLVGYTEATAAMSTAELAAVLAQFDERVTHIVHRGHGQVIKTIGDEALFVTEAAADACHIALALIDEFGHGRLPPVRVGLARGEVLSVLGDVYGIDVNLAARLVAAADPSTTLVSEAVRGEAGAQFHFDALEPRALKGFHDPVTTYRLAP